MKFLEKYPFIKIFLMLIIVSGGLFLFYINSVYENIKRDYQVKAVKHTELQYNILKRSLENTKKDIEYIRKTFEYFNNLDSSRDGKEMVTDSFKRAMESKKVYSQIRYIDNNGDEIVRVDYKNSFAEKIDESRLQNKGDRYYFKDARILKHGEVYISKFDLNVENKLIEIPYNPTIRFTTPVADNSGEVIGYIVINYQGKDILKQLRYDTQKIGVLLLNRDSFYLLGFNVADEWAFMFDRDINFKKDYPKIWRDVNKKDTLLVGNQDGVEFASKVINPVSIVSPERKSKSHINWILLSYVKKDVVLKEFYSFLFSIALMVYIVVALIVIVSYIISIYARQLSESNARTKIADRVLRSTIEGILVADRDVNILQVNRAFTDITGYSEDEIRGKNPRILKGKQGEDRNFHEKMWSSILKRGSWTGELKNQKKSGENFISKLSIGTVKKDGEVQYYIGVFSDVTKEREDREKLKRTAKALELSLEDLKSAQSKLVESEKLTVLGQLIAGISHEINSPLGAIKSSTDNILDSLEKVINSSTKLKELLNDHEKELYEKLKESIPQEMSVLSIKEQRALKKRLKEQLEKLEIEDSRYFAEKFSLFHVEDILEYRDLILHKEGKFIIESLGSVINSVSTPNFS